MLDKCKVLLRPRTHIFSKGKSAFLINKDIVLSSLCPALVYPKKVALHCLDVVRAIRICLSATASFGQAD